jgi:outer membrane protein TolC
MARLACDVARQLTPGGVMLILGLAVPVRADTLNGALINAYQNDPQLLSQRAVVRETDVSVPQALSGYRPSVSVTALARPEYSSIVSQGVGPTGAPVPIYSRAALGFVTSGVGITASQTLYDGFQTANRVRQAESSNTSAAREALRVAEQIILLNAATAYGELAIPDHLAHLAGLARGWRRQLSGRRMRGRRSVVRNGLIEAKPDRMGARSLFA